MRIVAAGEALLAPSITRRVIEDYAQPLGSAPGDDAGLEQLTERELEVLRLLATGKSNAELAAQLYLGEGTIKTHVSHVLGKLGLRDRVQAVVFAYESGLVEPGRKSPRWPRQLEKAGASGRLEERAARGCQLPPRCPGQAGHGSIRGSKLA